MTGLLTRIPGHPWVFVEVAMAESHGPTPLWDHFNSHGSLRVAAASTEHRGLTDHLNLPSPLR